MLLGEIKLYIENWLQSRYGQKTSINSADAIGGGSINEAYRLNTTAGIFFLKYNIAIRFPGMFTVEARGLTLLKEADCIDVPEVVHFSNTGNYSFLLLNFIQGNSQTPDFWHTFGTNLARLHRKTATVFGLDHDNFIGSLPQSNRNHPNWIEFLINERLNPQMKMAVDSGMLNTTDVKLLDFLYKRLPEIIPVEPPSLLHGDLWSGNFITGNTGKPCIIDPAVYYGHRETDLGMTRLFGGFPQTFYEAYNAEWPLEPGWQQRIPINQLYPLLVHVNLFGGGYCSQVRQILNSIKN